MARGVTPGGRAGKRPALDREESVAKCLRLRRLNELSEQLETRAASPPQPGETAQLNGIDAGARRGQRMTQCRALRGKVFRGGGHAIRQTCIQVAGARERLSRQRARVPNGRIPKIAGSQFGQANFDGATRIDDIAADDEPQRGLDSHQSRKALSTAGAWQQPQLDLGKSKSRGRGAQAGVAGHRDLESAAEARPCDCGNERFCRRIQGGNDRWQRRFGARRPPQAGSELLDVGAG